MKSEKNYLISNFNGTIELLFFLIQRHEIDISEIALSELTGQAKDIDLFEGAIFILYLCEMLLLKSRGLVGKDCDIKGAEPEWLSSDFFHYLIEYEKLRAVASQLQQLDAQEGAHFNRGQSEEEGNPIYEKAWPAVEFSLQELGELFSELLKKRPPEKRPERGVIRADNWSVSDKIKWLTKQLSFESVVFVELMDRASCREEMIVLFLAILELMRQGKAKMTTNPLTLNGCKSCKNQ